MNTFGRLLLAGIAGYAAGLPVGMVLVKALSSNRHDKSLEAAMTAAFVFGPIGAVIAMVAVWVFWVP